MRFINDRPYSDPEKAARKIVEIANADRRSPLGSRATLISASVMVGCGLNSSCTVLLRPS